MDSTMRRSIPGESTGGNDGVEPNRCAMRGREWIAVVLAIAVLIAGLTLLTGSSNLLWRGFWEDELYTYWLVADPSPGHALDALTAGADTNPPMLYLLMRAFCAVAGGASEVTLRLFSALMVWAALVGVYGLLRRWFGPLAVVVAVLAVWAQTLTLEQLYEARFYAAWLCATVWLLYLLTAPDAPPSGRAVSAARAVGVALLAVVVCTIHYFGIISLTLIAFGILIFHTGTFRVRLLKLLPLLAGPVALAACAPLLKGQRAGLSVATWVAPVTPEGAIRYLGMIVIARPYLIVLLAFVVSWLFTRPWRATSRPAPAQPMDSATARILDALRPLRPLAGVISLVLFPIAMIVVSVVLQPATVGRYSTVAVISLAPVAAMLATHTRRGVVLATAVALVLFAAWNLRDVAQKQRQDPTRIARLADVLEQLPADNAPIVFENRGTYYLVKRRSPTIASRCYMIDVTTAPDGAFHRTSTFDAALARKVAGWYDDTRFITRDKLRAGSGFYAVNRVEKERSPWVSRLFAGLLTPTPVSEQVDRMTPTASSASLAPPVSGKPNPASTAESGTSATAVNLLHRVTQ
jgi:hypothetical protein